MYNFHNSIRNLFKITPMLLIITILITIIFQILINYTNIDIFSIKLWYIYYYIILMFLISYIKCILNVNIIVLLNV